MVRQGRSNGSRRGVFQVFDTIETLFYGLIAVALFLALLFLGVRAAYRLAGPVGAGLAVGTILAVVGRTTLDIRRKRWSVASTVTFVAYALCVVAVIAADAIGG